MRFPRAAAAIKAMNTPMACADDCCNRNSPSPSHAYSSYPEFKDITPEDVDAFVRNLPAPDTSEIKIKTKEMLSRLSTTEYARCRSLVRAGYCSTFCMNCGVGAVLLGLMIAAEVDHKNITLMRQFHSRLMKGVNQVRRCGTC